MLKNSLESNLLYVINIVDGDTIDVQIENITQRVRLLGINNTNV
jgi:endonuclease YncB( thermonuclease family)